MTLSEYLKVKRGNAPRLANAINAHTPDVYCWAKEPGEKGYRPCPPAMCLAIERHTARGVTREELRPDDYWTIWPDIPPPEMPRRRREDQLAATT